MTQPKRYNRHTVRQDMNLALDDMLTDATPLYRHLDQSPKDARLWADMQTVDRLLTTEPMLQAPIDFASKVMASIAAGDAEDAEAHPLDERSDLRAVVALVLTVIVLLPVVLGTSLTLYNLIRDPGAMNVLVHQITWVFNVLAQAFNSTLQAVAPYATTLLLALGALSATFYITMFWIGLTRTMQRRQMVVYRIPVTVA